MANLAQGVLAGSRLALARLLTQLENNQPEGWEALDVLYPHTGRAHVVGITGSPGTGKSSLVNQLALWYRNPKGDIPARRVAIVAVDPSSPFSGGALLGDRVRMRDLCGDPGVFIRSMASRGALGGLAWNTAAVVQVLDAAGFEIILTETVGAGQAEVDIARLAHTTVVVEAPGLGDDIQAIKAGILEIADILVVNKADLPGADNTERHLRVMLELAYPERLERSSEPECPAERTPGWQPTLIRTIASQGIGVEEVALAILSHGECMRQTGEWMRRDRARLQNELEIMLREKLLQQWRARIAEDFYQAALDQLCQRRLSPHRAVEVLIEKD